MKCPASFTYSRRRSGVSRLPDNAISRTVLAGRFNGSAIARAQQSESLGDVPIFAAIFDWRIALPIPWPWLTP
jgi:hypothetical protein